MSYRTLRLVIILIGFYLLSATGYLLHRSFAATKSSVTLLQAGESTLLTDPAAATKDFHLSEQAAEDSLGTIRDARWWNRLISLLPPLRWQVQLAKASYSLAQAGQSTIALQQSLIALNQAPVTSDDPLITTGNRYLGWYGAQAPAVTLLHTQLMEAKSNFDPIPEWIFLSQSDNFIRLKAQLAELTETIGSDQRTGDGTLSLAAHSKQVLVILLPSGPADPGSLGTLTLQDGRIQSLTFAPLPSPLLVAYRTGSEHDAFWPQTARDLALQVAGSSEPAGGITVIDPSLIKDLLRISGPIQLSGVANPTVSSVNWNTSQVSPGQLLGQLTSSLLQTEHKFEAASSLQLALRNQSLQFWSSNLTLFPTLATLPDYSAPSGHSNWLRIIPEGSNDLNVIIQQTSHTLQQETLQTVSVTGSTTAPHIALPPAARLDDGSVSSIRSGYLEATMLLSNNGYTVRYSLPQTTNEPTRIHYLAPLSGIQKVTAFGQEKLITRDAVLTP